MVSCLNSSKFNTAFSLHFGDISHQSNFFYEVMLKIISMDWKTQLFLICIDNYR